MHLIPVLTPEQVRRWDAAAVAAGLPLRMLMEQAGRAVAAAVLERFASAAQQGVLVACGPGNNGGDGWVVARALHAAGVPVWVAESGVPGPGIAADARQAARADGVRAVPADGPWPGIGLGIDALLGTGSTGAPRSPVAALLQRLGDLQCPIVAIDGPTGLDLANGVDHGAVAAVMTVTFGGIRRGHLLARDEIGDLLVADIGLPAADPSWPAFIDRRWAADRVAPFAAKTYKNMRGRVVIIGGAPAMTGAARLAARAAFGAGAGLVHVVAPEASLATLRLAEPDVQTMAQPFDAALSAEVVDLIARADVVAIGPGLGRDAGRARFVLDVLQHVKCAVVDADALTVLRPERAAFAAIAATRPIVCTPHAGEFRTLFGDHAGELETAPWEAAAAAAAAVHATILLKGVPTVVASPDGVLFTVAAGNPGLATGGSGDLLTGIIATLLAQGIVAVEAAATGAQAHGEAADQAARWVTARAMRPTDVIAALPDVWRAWARGAARPRTPWLAELPSPDRV